MGYRPRTGTVFFTRNGKKLDEVAHGLKTQNFFPTVGANGPCTIHVNFGQSGFVFIEANVKKWGLAPMTGSLAPPPPYGSEQGSILLEAGREGTRGGHGSYANPAQRRSRGFTRSGQIMSPGPVRSPTDISLAQLSHIPSNEDVGEGTSRSAASVGAGIDLDPDTHLVQSPNEREHFEETDLSAPPPDYSSPTGSRRSSEGSENSDGYGCGEGQEDRRPMIRSHSPRPPIPSYDAAVGNAPARGRNQQEE